MELESRTVRAMILIYCRAHHHGAVDEPCARCAELLAYAEARIAHCPFGIDKPVCNKCKVHCYNPAKREEIKRVMRFAGPRMLARHPIMAIRHMVRSRNANRDIVRSRPRVPAGKP